MYNVIEGIREEQWHIDPDLKALAVELIGEHEEIGYIDPNKVLFCSVVGAITSRKWWGLCTKLAHQVRLIPFQILEVAHHGDVDAMESVSEDLLDIRFIISINRDSINSAGGDPERLTRVTMLHELMHIDMDMEKIVPHDTKDFKSILDTYGVHWTSGYFKSDEGMENSE